jgi:polygalacturonase
MAHLEEDFAVNSFISRRRDFLRAGSFWTAAASVPGSALAVSIQTAPPPGTGSQVRFDVRWFGAAEDGKALDTMAVNRAIEASSAVVVVFFTAGTHLCFSIHLKNKVHLYLEQGCAIVAADSPRKGKTKSYRSGVYDHVEFETGWDPYQDYGHNHWHNSLIWGEGIHDFTASILGN